MAKKKLKYSRFSDRINMEAFYNAVNFDPTSSTRDEDTGYCSDMFGLHTHGDTTGKLSFNHEKKVYNCWVCGGGTLLDYAMNYNSMDGEDATHWLYQFVEGEESDEDSALRWKQKLWAQKGEPLPLPYFNEHVLSKWEEYHPWMRRRGINRYVAKEYKLRYNKQAMKRAPKGKEDEGAYVSPVIVFPHFWQGKLVGWQQRWMKDDRPKWVPKYTNTPDFPKEETIFNYDRAQRTEFEVVVVESVPTVLFLESCGVPAVCTFGDSVSDEQLRLLRAFQGGVIISADADKASLKWRATMTDYLERFIPVLHCPLVDKEGTKRDLGDLAPNEQAVYDILERSHTPLTATLERMRADANR